MEDALREGPEKAKRFIQERIEEQNLRTSRRTGPEFCDNMDSEWVTRCITKGKKVYDPADRDALEWVLSDDEDDEKDPISGAEAGDGRIDGTSLDESDANALTGGEAVLEETHSREPGSESGAGGQGDDDTERQVSAVREMSWDGVLGGRQDV